uniref:Uncharacterized protein n=1 Tax=Panagrolaimus davidi TaxID=227884 RepID=A0A914QHP4_9BILA
MDLTKVEDFEEIEKLRKQICRGNKNFDQYEITAVNYSSAIGVGAKTAVDQKIMTRNATAKISTETGYTKNELLYSGLPYENREKTAAKNILIKRSEDIFEMFEDFQTQLNVKRVLLKKYCEETGIFQENRSRRHHPYKVKMNALQTPKNSITIDPFDYDVQMNVYLDSKIEELDRKIFSKKSIPFDLDDSFY